MSELLPDEKMKDKLGYICRQFRIPGDIIIYRYIPMGHINTAYYVALYDGSEVRQYLVQMVNWYVFKDPASVMNNINLVTEHIMNKEKTLERRRRLHFHHTSDGKNYLIFDDNGKKEFWRLCNYVESSVSFETADGNPEVLRMSGQAFGKFNRQLQDFDASKLVESIPHFHDTPYRLNTFFKDVEADTANRVRFVRDEISHIEKYTEYAATLCNQIEKGELPLRVTHNDTKTNNVMFDKLTLDPLVIIDLDTCMPGLACYDFGDTIRFAACTSQEDEKDLSKVKLDLDLFKAYAEGYLSETKDFLSEAEIRSLTDGACIITLELASRFLDDYITGDKYFRTDYAEHNLDRARCQLALFDEMMDKKSQMDDIIKQIVNS